MRIANLNPADGIGASCWVADICGRRIMLDAGINPKTEGIAGLPLYDRIEPNSVDAIALSHCHHDHVGSLPVALKRFPHASVFMTDLSYFFVERVLHNSVNVMNRRHYEANIQDYPLFTHEEVDEMAYVFHGVNYGKTVTWGFNHQNSCEPQLTFFDAGHALGSAGVLIKGDGESLFYTGDVSFRPQTLLNGAHFDDIHADVLIMETTRGDRATPEGFSRENEADRLAASISEVIARDACVLIPVFGLGRSQEILAQLALLMHAGKIPKRPIYVAGIGRVLTEIYDLEARLTNRTYPDLKLSEALELIVLRNVNDVELVGGRIFVLTSGMMAEGTASHDMAVRMIPDASQAIFFVGYVAPDSPAGALKNAPLGSSFVFSPSRGELTRYCTVQDFDFGAHAFREDLLDFVGKVQPTTVVLGHGEPTARTWFQEQILQRHPGMRVIQPAPGLAEII